MILHDISRIFHKLPGIIFFFFNVAVINPRFPHFLSYYTAGGDLKPTTSW